MQTKLEHFVSLVDTLASRLKINLNLGAENTCQIFFDRDAINFEITDESFYIYAPIYPSEGCSETSLKKLLELNHLGERFISISPSSGDLCLNLVITDTCDYESFEDRLALFIKSLRDLKQDVKTNSFATYSSSKFDRESKENLFTNVIPV